MVFQAVATNGLTDVLVNFQGLHLNGWSKYLVNFLVLQQGPETNTSGVSEANVWLKAREQDLAHRVPVQSENM